MEATEAVAGVTGPCPQCGVAVTAPGGPPPVQRLLPPPVPASASAAGVDAPPHAEPPRGTVKSGNPVLLVLGASLTAGFVCMAAICVHVSRPLEPDIFSKLKSPQVSGQAIIYAVGILTLALVIGMGTAALLLTFRQRFVTSLLRAYSISAVALSIALLSAGVTWQGKRFPWLPAEPKVSDADLKKMADLMEDTLQWAKKRKAGDDAGNLEFHSMSTAPPRTDAERMQAVTQKWLKELAEQQKDYLKELDSAGITRLLKPERVEADTGFVESKAMLGVIRETVTRHRKQGKAAIDGYPVDVAAVIQDDGMRKIMVTTINLRLAKSLPLLTERWDLEVALVDRYEELLKILESARGHWTVRNSQFLFQEDADVERYNKVMQQVTKASAREEAIQQEMMGNAAATLDTMRKSGG